MSTPVLRDGLKVLTPAQLNPIAVGLGADPALVAYYNANRTTLDPLLAAGGPTTINSGAGLRKILANDACGLELARLIENSSVAGVQNSMNSLALDPALAALGAEWTRLKNAAPVAAVNNLWSHTPHKVTLDEMLTHVGETGMAEKVRGLSLHVGEDGELLGPIRMQLDMMKGGMYSSQSDKVAAGRGMQSELRTLKEELLALQRDVTGRGASLISAVTQEIKDGAEKLKDASTNLGKSYSSNGGKIQVADIKKAADDIASQKGMKDLLLVDITKSEIYFAGNKIGSFSGTELDVKASKDLIDKLGERANTYQRSVGERATELVKEMTEGLKKRAEAIETVQHELASLSGAPAKGKMIGTVADTFKREMEAEAPRVTQPIHGEGASMHVGATVAGALGAEAIYRMMLKPKDEDQSVGAGDAIALSVGAVAGQIGGRIFGKKPQVAMGAMDRVSNFAELATQGVAHLPRG